MVFPIDLKFERIIQRTFVALLQPKGYQRYENQFYHKLGRVGKLITIRQNTPDGYQHHLILFTIRVDIVSDDFWELNHPDKAIPVLPFINTPIWEYCLVYRHLGLFYGKNRGDTYIAVDLVLPEAVTVNYLRTLLSTKIIPYAEKFNSIDDILSERRFSPSGLKMTMLAWLGRQNEARSELRKVIASRHQKGFRISAVGLARKYDII